MADRAPLTESHVVWNYLRIQRVPAEGSVRLIVGPGGLLRQQAIDGVLSFLDYVAKNAATPTVREEFRLAAESWRLKTAAEPERGVVPDDEVFVGDFVWAVYLHFDTVDPVNAAIDWAQEFSGNRVDMSSIRQIRKNPDHQPGKNWLTRLVRRRGRGG